MWKFEVHLFTYLRKSFIIRERLAMVDVNHQLHQL
jgi:hypothetical protein